MTSVPKIVTVDKDAHEMLIKCLTWSNSRPPLLWLERYEVDDSMNKMLGYFKDHVYEELGIDEEHNSEFFIRLFFKDGKLAIEDENGNDWLIEIQPKDTNDEIL